MPNLNEHLGMGVHDLLHRGHGNCDPNAIDLQSIRGNLKEQVLPALQADPQWCPNDRVEVTSLDGPQDDVFTFFAGLLSDETTPP